MYQAEKCRHCGKCTFVCPNGSHSMGENGHCFDITKCKTCGACARICPAGAAELSGREMTVDEVFDEVVRDKIYYKTSHGGVTVSGGEPLAHSAFVAELLRRCREQGIHTAIETSGFASKNALLSVIEHCDLVLFDIKETDPENHKKFTGVPLEPILDNLNTISEKGVHVYLRLPIIPGLNDRTEHLEAVRKIASSLKSCVGVQVMPYHILGAYKYEALGREYACEGISEPDSKTVAKWREIVGDTTNK